MNPAHYLQRSRKTRSLVLSHNSIRWFAHYYHFLVWHHHNSRQFWEPDTNVNEALRTNRGHFLVKCVLMYLTFLITTPQASRSVMSNWYFRSFWGSWRIWHTVSLAGFILRSSAKIGDPLKLAGFFNVAAKVCSTRKLFSKLSSP